MDKAYSTFALSVVLSASPAFGQYGAIIQSCSRDVAAFCGTVQSSGVTPTECIEAHFQRLSTPCQTALVKIAAVRETCKADIQAQCPAVTAGAGRILLCVKKQFSALSEACKYAIGKAAERQAGAY